MSTVVDSSAIGVMMMSHIIHLKKNWLNPFTAKYGYSRFQYFNFSFKEEKV